MKHALPALALAAAAACGGPSSPSSTGPGNTGGAGAPASPAEALWAAVLVPGATFALEDSVEPGTIVVATVHEVRPVDGGRMVIVDWSLNGHSIDDLPQVFVLGHDTVTFHASLEALEMDPELATTYPVTPGKLADGAYVGLSEAMPDALCFGQGPLEEDADCDDVCFAELCVHPTHGFVGGAGTWWPQYSVFHRTSLAR